MLTLKPHLVFCMNEGTGDIGELLSLSLETYMRPNAVMGFIPDLVVPKVPEPTRVLHVSGADTHNH